jgi:hypothetical protein
MMGAAPFFFVAPLFALPPVCCCSCPYLCAHNFGWWAMALEDTMWDIHMESATAQTKKNPRFGL